MPTLSPESSWRRLTITLLLEVFGGVALWFDKLGPEVWSIFACVVALLFIGGATAQRITEALAGRLGGTPAPPPADPPVPLVE